MQNFARHIKRVVFWEPSVSPHKAPLFRAIKRQRTSVELVHVAQADIAQDRQAMGWVSPKPFGYEQFIGPDKGTCRALATEQSNETFHVFSGIRHVPCIVEGLQQVQRSGAKFALMSEPRVNEGVKGIFRYLQSWVTEGQLRRQAACIFAIGRNGPPWFESVGYAVAKVFPFAYFIDQLPSATVVKGKASTKLRIGYLGRLVRPKGIFTLLEAFNQLSPDEASLQLAGPFGDEEVAVRAAVKFCQNNVVLKGPIPMTAVPSFLDGLDVLVLPSITKDGWGVVVTEALMMGLPVVATTCVGASLVIRDERLGIAIAPNDANALAAAIRAITQPKNLTAQAREWRKAWANQHLSAQAGAAYFWAVLDHCSSGTGRPAPFYQ